MLRRSIVGILLSIQVAASCAPPLWNSYGEVRGRAGDYRSGAMLYGFAPLVQDDCSLLFAQANIGQMRHQTTGSLGFGYRRKIECDSFFGIAGFADWSRTGQHNNYLQGVVSSELIVRCAELRANAYVPYQKSHILDESINHVVRLDGVEVFLERTDRELLEQAYPGFDVEGGFNHELGCGSRIRGYAAYFHYARQGVSDIYGPRIRVRYELDNMGCCGTRFTAEGIWQYDQVRGHKGEAMIGFRMPLCKPKCCNLCPVDRRMNDLVERDIGLIVRKNERFTERPTELLTRLFFFEHEGVGNGEQTSPASLDFVEMMALPGDILFGLNNNGTVQLSNMQLTLLDRQQLYGFNGKSSVTLNVGDGFTLTVNDLTGAGRAELLQMDNMVPVVTAADHNTIFGLKLTDGSIGIDMTGSTDILVQKVNIDPPAVAGLNIVNSTDIMVLDSSIEAASATAVIIDGGGNIVFDNCTFTNAGGVGFDIMNTTGPITATDSTLTQTDSMAARLIANTNEIDLSGLDITGVGGTSTEQIIVQGGALSVNKFGKVNLTNLDNTVGNAPFVSVTDFPFVNFVELNVQGTGGTGLFANQYNGLVIDNGSLNIENGAACELTNGVGTPPGMQINLASVTSTNSPGNGITIENLVGSNTFNVTGTTLIDTPTARGLEVQGDGEILSATFGTLEVRDSGMEGVVFTNVAGSFTADTVTITDPAASQLAMDVQGPMPIPGFTVDITTLNVDSGNLNSGAVTVSGQEVNFTAKGGHILLSDAQNTSGFNALNCDGPISISGTAANPFEIAGMGKSAVGTIAGIQTLECANLTFDHCYIHDIGDGTDDTNRFGILANQALGQVTVTNCTIEDIDGNTDINAFTTVVSEAISIRQPLNGVVSNPQLDVCIESNTLTGIQNTGRQHGIHLQFGNETNTNPGTVTGKIAKNTLDDWYRGVDLAIGGSSTNNEICVDENTITGIGFVSNTPRAAGIIFEGARESETDLCIRKNIVDAEDGAFANEGIITSYRMGTFPPGPTGNVNVTIQDNTVFSSNNDYISAGICVDVTRNNFGTATCTALVDNNSANNVATGHAFQSFAGGGIAMGDGTLVITYTNNTSTQDLRATNQGGSNNTIVGDPVNPGSNGNDVNSYIVGGGINLGAINTTPPMDPVLTAIVQLGNLANGMTPTNADVTVVPNVFLIDANTTNFPQPPPCPPLSMRLRK